jgi:hypothetical protein
VCGHPVGHCEQATCTSGSDCATGFECADYYVNFGCSAKAFACQSSTDTCLADTDCAGGTQCGYQNGARVCQSAGCATVGRPFLVDGAARVARPDARGDWRARGVSPAVSALSDAVRAELAVRWTEIGLMEHASIAAFARFTLHLLALGAPPDLLRDAQRAMADETQHAQLAFALAEVYGGRDVGPGALAMEGALEWGGVAELAATVIREGCIGETAAAIEAREALEHAQDPEVRAVLARIATDETRHAGLAWRTVAWFVETGAMPIEALRAEFDRALFEARELREPPREDRGLLDHGILGEAARRQLRQAALASVIAPCARTLLRMTDSTGDARHCAWTMSDRRVV